MKPAIFGGNTPPLPAGVSIRVYVSATAILATIYNFDTDLAIDQVALPFVADADGRFAFTTDPGQMIDVQLGGEGNAADLLFNGGVARWFKRYTISPSNADNTAENETSHTDIYEKSNILGPVSQSGGVPTGAIIESGSNANGYYVKYADGTMICRGAGGSVKTTDTAVGSVYREQSPTAFAFPVAFISTVSLVVTPIVVPANGYPWCTQATSPTTSITTLVLLGTSSGDSGFIGYIAIGRWF